MEVVGAWCANVLCGGCGLPRNICDPRGACSSGPPSACPAANLCLQPITNPLLYALNFILSPTPRAQQVPCPGEQAKLPGLAGWRGGVGPSGARYWSSCPARVPCSCFLAWGGTQPAFHPRVLGTVLQAPGLSMAMRMRRRWLRRCAARRWLGLRQQQLLAPGCRSPHRCCCPLAAWTPDPLCRCTFCPCTIASCTFLFAMVHNNGCASCCLL